MSATITDRAQQLLTDKNFAHVATLRSDGTVHGVPVWVDIQDGLPVLNSAQGRSWVRNLERDPRITFTVQSAANPYEYVEVRGTATHFTTDGADQHIDSLANKYMGVEQYPLRQPGEQRVIISVQPEHVHVSPPQ
jgi:PPOX class probable F420-dependent enzyme